MSRLQFIRQRLRAWSSRHFYSFFASLGALMAHRLGTLMTVLVLGIALLLPLGLHVTLINLDRLDLGESEWGALTVFLQAGTSAGEAGELAAALEGRDGVDAVTLISPDQALAEFRAASGFGESLKLLEENPLPYVLSVVADSEAGNGLETRVAALMDWLLARPEVASVEVDQKWLQRLARLLDFGRVLVIVLVVIFSLAVVVVVANTIRLDVATRAEEIEVLALIGAKDAFIRQPFLYSGLWYGLLGGLVALILANLALVTLEFPFRRLLDSYGQQVGLLGPGLRTMGGVMMASGLLGLLGAWISVQHYLRLLRGSGQLGRR